MINNIMTFMEIVKQHMKDEIQNTTYFQNLT